MVELVAIDSGEGLKHGIGPVDTEPYVLRFFPGDFSSSHIEGSSTSVGRPGNSQYPLLAIENVDVCQPILLDVSFHGIHVSRCRSSSRAHTYYHHVQHCSDGIVFTSSSDMSIPA